MEDAALIGEQVRGLLEFLAGVFNADPALQEELKGELGWINLTMGLRTADWSVEKAIVFKDGFVSVLDQIPGDTDCTIVYTRSADIIEMLNATPDESYNMILKGRVRAEGNIIYVGLWNYLMNLVVGAEQQEAVERQIEAHREAKRALAANACAAGRRERPARRITRIRGTREDPGVKYLEDPYLACYGLEDFPRLAQMREERFNAKCEFTSEFGKLLTDFHVANGYEYDRSGAPWDPLLRKAESVRYLLEKREPLIRKNDLLGGTWTTNPVLGGVGRPYSEGCHMWGELNTCARREYEPYAITPESVKLFHKYIFPFWAARNLHELWKSEYGNPLPARIHELFFAIFYWATVSQSENNPGFEKVLQMGTRGLIEKIEAELASDAAAGAEKKNTLEGMKICLQGVNSYARNLAARALAEAEAEADPARKEELLRIYRHLCKVPENPAETLDEAVQSIVVTLLCLGWETMDASISLGRLDQVLQPYFAAEMAKLERPAEREAFIRHAVELIGCLYLLVASRLIIAVDLGNWQNSGSPPNTCVTVGGVTPDGKDAVNDMTYIILKVTELLALNHPNVHARYKPGVNSMAYLTRVAGVNYITGATPAIHNDDAIIDALSCHEGWALEDIRDYASTGCVEPSLPGKHAGTTSALEINLVAPFEMALHNGRHPVADWALGPQTGVIENGAFRTFEEFFAAFQKQCIFMLEQAVAGNNQLGELFHRHHPHLLLSALTDGCIESGKEFLRGGAKYNSSGVSMIGLADVVDSLMVIKKLVFDAQAVTFAALKEAADGNFAGHPVLHAMVNTKVARFGSGDAEALAMARRVMRLVGDFFAGSRDYKGGVYTTGWWSMAHHVSYGRVTGALPSGRLAGEPFTPGLTPHPRASSSLLDNLRDVARLDHKAMDNNIAFNVKIVPGLTDSPEQVVAAMAQYMKTYFELGGMQLQFNVVDSDTLKDAMANPEYYRDLMVRISGYVAYFTGLHHELQLELVRRAEYRL
jgi:formate C-acetyltransferase